MTVQFIKTCMSLVLKWHKLTFVLHLSWTFNHLKVVMATLKSKNRSFNPEASSCRPYFIWSQGSSSLRIPSPGTEPPPESGGPAASRLPPAPPGAGLPHPDPAGTVWLVVRGYWWCLQKVWNGWNVEEPLTCSVGELYIIIYCSLTFSVTKKFYGITVVKLLLLLWLSTNNSITLLKYFAS